MATCVRISVCIALAYFTQVSAEKRLVLHSDLDLSSALHTVDQNLTAFEKRVIQVESRIGQLEAENKLLATVNLQLTTTNKNLGDRVTHLENSTKELKAQLIKVDNQNAGVTYVRWGRSTCPGNGTSSIYKGYVGGTLYSDKGGGSNSLCLPDDPTWNKYVDGFAGAKSAIYGTEIEVDAGFSTAAIGYNYNNQDPPCVSCYTSRATVVMVPGRSNCYPGWTLEYTGYLIGGFKDHSNNDYICFDSKPEALPHGLSSDSDDQHVLYYVEAHCGSLPCPPYHDGREVACVVCSK